MQKEERVARCGLILDRTIRSAQGLRPLARIGWAEEAVQPPVVPIPVNLEHGRFGKLPTKSDHRDAGGQWSSQKAAQESPEPRRFASVLRFLNWKCFSLRKLR
jgi:hypothetical protein